MTSMACRAFALRARCDAGVGRVIDAPRLVPRALSGRPSDSSCGLTDSLPRRTPVGQLFGQEPSVTVIRPGSQA